MRLKAAAVAALAAVSSAYLMCGVAGRVSPQPAAGMIVYTGLPAEEAEIFTGAFEKKHGVRVELEAVKTGEMTERLLKESASPAASVVFGGSLPSYLAAKEKGLFEVYRSPAAKGFDRKFVDGDGMWTGIYVGIIGFCTGRASGVEPPASWDDLLKPEFKGRIVLASPLSSGTAYITLATLVQLMGEDGAFEYMKRLDGQVAAYTRSGSKPCRMAYEGAAAVGVSFAHDILQVDRGGKKLALSFPKEGTGLEIGGAAVVKGAPNVSAARAFVDFLCSRQVQSLYGSAGIPPRFPTHPKVKPPVDAFAKGKLVKFVQFDFEWSGRNEERLKKKWENLVYGARR
ncbi:MAG: ABC transporter substrate-binding protein [bacterium]